VLDAEKANYPIAWMCRLLGVPRSSFYAWTHRAETPTRARRRALAVEVAKEFDASRQTSGCRRITAALNRRGIAASVGLVAGLMRELGPAAVQPRALQAHHAARERAGSGAGPAGAGVHRARARAAAGRGHHRSAHR
jgi:putative transposase